MAQHLDRKAELDSEASFHALRQVCSSHTGVLSTPILDPVLHNARFLRRLSTSDKNVVLQSARSHSYSIDSVVAEQGTMADRLFLLLKGSARYFFITPEGRKVNLFWLVPGDIFGTACLLCSPARLIVSTEITKDSHVLVWRRDTIRILAAKYPQLLENGLSIARDYLVWYLATHLSLVCHSARQRLANVLVSLSRGIGHKCTNGIRLEITNEQLANTANLTPFTVSRLLSKWQRNGSLLKSRGQIVLCRPEHLFHDPAANRTQ